MVFWKKYIFYKALHHHLPSSLINAVSSTPFLKHCIRRAISTLSENAQGNYVEAYAG
jgi:hypothetical protein